MQRLIQHLKPKPFSLKTFIRWLIIGFTLFFVLSALKQHWREILLIQITHTGWACLAIALGIILFANIWSGWVWGWILLDFNQSVSGTWSVPVYIKTNLAKYLPGNIWHFYGRITAAKTAGIPLDISTLSVIFEPLLMAAAALIVASSSYAQAIGPWNLALPVVLIGLHPRFINQLLAYLKQLKIKQLEAQIRSDRATQLHRYPWRPLLGELGFIALRSLAFLLILLALQPIQPEQIFTIIGSYSLAWLVGFVVPGAPGGIGVFEATALWLLQPEFSTGFILAAIALHRFISLVSELSGAVLVSLDQYWNASFSVHKH
jgi:hypothetical protein